MKYFLTIIISISMFYASAQKTITKRGYDGKPYEQYQVDANGTYHGFYKRFFDNGFLETDAIYYKGTQISSKTYEYYGKIRYLMYDVTWDRKGKVLTSKQRMVNYSTGDVGELIQKQGLLPNGNGLWFYNYFVDKSYTEQYKGNDTSYVWVDKTKKQFIGKYLNDERVLTKDELKAKLAEDLAYEAEEKVKAKQDSIRNAKLNEEKLLNDKIRDQQFQARLDEETKRLDSISASKQFVIVTDALYTKLLKDYYDGDEANFYKQLVKCLNKNKNVDIQLQKNIAKVVGVPYDEINNWSFIASWSVLNYDGVHKIYTTRSLGRDYGPYALMACSQQYNNYSLNVVHNKQLALIDIINYLHKTK